MTQQKQNGKLIAIITMIFLFGMISFLYTKLVDCHLLVLITR